MSHTKDPWTRVRECIRACANLPEPEKNIRELVEATDELIAETEGLYCDCQEGWASDVEPNICAYHATKEALKPFMKEKK